jgi:endonuclease/exonuclease/phosphatase family metal-dependent hydrolase
LQEVWRDSERDQALELAELCGLHAAWWHVPGPPSWRQRDPNVRIGNAVLSRWPIIDRVVMRLPIRPGHDEGRCVTCAVVDAPAGPIAFFTTQLASAPTDSGLRVRQVAAIARFVAEHRVRTFPPIVTGDFNALPDSDEIRLLEGHLTEPAVAGSLLVDAWRYADPSAPGLTWNRANPHVRATFEPSGRIDYVFVGPPGPSDHGHVEAVALIGDEPRGDIWASDHAGVLVHLNITIGADDHTHRR